MPGITEFGKLFKNGLSKTAFFTTFPLSILLVPLETLVDGHFSCPCKAERNAITSNMVFAAPFVFFLALMCLVLQPLRFERQECLKKFSLCLIPSLVWIILLLTDGNYIACRDTFWDGVYVSLDEHERIKWCKPTQPVPGKNETELQDLTLSFIAKSQITGYVLLLALGILMFIGHFIYCCCCKERQKEEQSEKQSFEGTFVCHRHKPDPEI